ncbi:MAG TPA: hypothetical protein PKA38_04555 [Candidatus Levybacteria bacterium]|nr:hypothetical protein [Candidatus Levybacteria bacterium]
MQYLKEDQYYIDLYDLHTIEECLDMYFSLKEGMEKERGKIKSLKPDDFDKEVHKGVSYTVNVIKIQRYRHKAGKIREWMDRDRKIQEKYDKATPPDDIYCAECFSATKVTSKDLLGSYEEKDKVMFMLACVKCNKRQAIYEDGTEWIYTPPKCPKCNSPLNHDSKHTKNKLTTIYTCSSCSYKNEDVHDFKKSDEEREKKDARDKKLLGEYRKEFCLDDEEGPKAVLNLDNIVRFVDEMKKNEVKEKDPDYQKVKQLKSLKIGQLKELLEKTIEKEGYQDLKFDKPEIGQFVIIEFSVNDMKEDRQQYDSQKTLKKMITRVLEDTTWRLMSDGISYRLGILTGRLKAFEREEDLVKLVKPEK